MIKQSRISATGNYSYSRYFRIDNRAWRWGSHVATCGESRVTPGSVYPPIEHPTDYHFNWELGRTLTECQIVYISEGRGTIETEDSSFPIRAGDALLLRPGVWHRYRPAPETGWHEYWVGLGGVAVDQILGAGLLGSEEFLVAIREERALVGVFQDLFNVAEQNGAAVQQEMAARAMVILSLIYASTRPANSAITDDVLLIEKARAFMFAEETRAMPLERMAQQLNISYSKLRRLFRDNTGVSLHQYRIHLRISSARELLRSTSLMIKEISFQCGFEEEHYFCRLFKIHTGISPSEFRAQCLQSQVSPQQCTNEAALQMSL